MLSYTDQYKNLLNGLKVHQRGFEYQLVHRETWKSGHLISEPNTLKAFSQFRRSL